MFQASLSEQFSLQKHAKIVDPRTLDQLPHLVVRMPDRFTLQWPFMEDAAVELSDLVALFWIR